MRDLQSIEIAESLNASHVIFYSQVNPILSVRRIREMKLNKKMNFGRIYLIKKFLRISI